MMTSSSMAHNGPSLQEDTAGSNNIKHLLVIRLSAMGDVAMLVPVLRALTARYPSLRFTVLTQKFFTPIFKNIPNVSVFEAHLKGKHKGIKGVFRLAGEIKKFKFDAVADVHNVLRTNILKVIFYFSGIFVKQIDKGREEKKALTASNNKVFRQLKSTHERYADVFAELGFPVDLNSPHFPEKQKLSPGILKITGKELKKWIGIAPFAQHSGKMYPIDRMGEVLALLNAEDKYKILLFGGGHEEKEKLEQLALQNTNSISLAGKLSFEEELAVISNLDLMLSMDSGNAHLAAMYGIPVITLWGVTHPYAGFSAFGQSTENNLLPDLEKYPLIPTSIYGNKVPAGYEDVMYSITPERVVEKIKEVTG